MEAYYLEHLMQVKLFFALSLTRVLLHFIAFWLDISRKPTMTLF